MNINSTTFIEENLSIKNLKLKRKYKQIEWNILFKLKPLHLKPYII